MSHICTECAFFLRLLQQKNKQPEAVAMDSIPPFASVPCIYWLDKAANKVT
jgi:hypothetical protein